MQTATKPRAVPAQFDRASQHRRSMIAKINIAKAQLQMAEDDYRQGLLDATGKLSLRDCSDAQLERMVAWLGTKGFKALPHKKAAAHPMGRKARALWISLYHLGEVHNSSEQALEAFAKRQLGCETLNWARQSDAYRLIEALKAWAVRSGWRQTDAIGKPARPALLQIALCQAILERLKTRSIAGADWSLDTAAHRLCGIRNEATGGVFTVQHYERLAAALGTVLRENGGSHADAR